MSVSLYAARKKIKTAILESQTADYGRTDDEKKAALYIRVGLQRALVIIDDELEADGEREFIRPIKPSGLWDTTSMTAPQSDTVTFEVLA